MITGVETRNKGIMCSVFMRWFRPHMVARLLSHGDFELRREAETRHLVRHIVDVGKRNPRPVTTVKSDATNDILLLLVILSP